jgi:prophage antirepressor-like protein
MNQNKVQQFLNDNFGEVRVEKSETELWFCATDIAKILNYSSTQKITDKVDDEDKDYRTWVTLGGNQTMVCINESGLYQAILSITKKDIERYNNSRDFKRWITGTVIPAIRKDGAYVQGEEEFVKGEISEEELVLQAMTILQNKVVRLKQENEEMKPKVKKWDQFIKSDGTYSFTECAKLVSTMAESEKSDVSITVGKLTELLRNEGILNKSKTPDKEGKKGSYKNLPNKDYETMFDVVSVGTGGGFNKTQTRVKASGVEFIYDLLKNKQRQEA